MAPVPREFDSSAIGLPTVPGYTVLGVLGVGGMGVVYRALDTALNRPVALKMIAPERADPPARRRFRTEAQTVARLRHPHVVQVYEVGESEGRPFLALELVEGGSLADYLLARGPMPAPQAALLVAALARGMHHAHERGVIHRDLKPANILLAALGEGEIGRREEVEPRSSMPESLHPKIADFGLAKLLDSDQGRTRSGAVMGTPAYMAPEQARGGIAITPAADLYALGAVLFECLTGQPPFDGEGAWEVLAKVLSADPPRPSDLRPRLSRDLDTICLKCLAKDPARRYPTAAALAEDLERFAAGEAIAARPERAVGRLLRRLKRRPLPVAGSLLLAGTVALAGGFWELRRAQAGAALDEGRALAERGEHDSARDCFDRGYRKVEGLPGCVDLGGALARAAIAAELRHLAERMIFESDPDHLSADEQRRRANECLRLWRARERVLAQADGDFAWEAQARADLRDLALRGLEMQRRLDPGLPSPDQLRLLDELEEFGVSGAILHPERGSGRSETPGRSWPVPTSATEAHLLGRALARIGDLTAADECLRAGLRLNPREEALHFARAELAVRRRDHGSALESYAACLALRPSAVVFACRGFVHLARGDEARRAWIAAPTHLAGLARAASAWQEALADFEAALSRKGDHAPALLGRGQANLRLGRLKQARADLEQALELGYPPDRGLLPLAVAALQTGDPDEARRRLRQLIALAPNDADARRLLDSLRPEGGTPP